MACGEVHSSEKRCCRMISPAHRGQASIEPSINRSDNLFSGKMVFILGVNFPERNLLKKSLESFFGIGNHTSSRLLARFNIHPTCRVGELANKQVLDMTAVLSDMKIENDLRREVLNDIKRLKETGTYRGRRHALGLPVRGQRTRTQIKTPVKLNRMERRM
ncbi:unnamed protein product [Penicillium pancosmium]